MLAAILLAAATTTTLPPPAAGLELTPGPPPRPAVVSRPLPPPTSSSLPPALPDLGFLTGVASALLAAVRDAAKSKRREVTPSAWGGVPADLNVVFVGGHGSELAGTFDEIIAALHLQSDQIHHFDYRWVESVDSHASATRDATNDEIVDGLNGFLAGLATTGQPIYLVGFSKGGAAIAGLLKEWDHHPQQAIDSVIGAAMLEPPISRGFVGWLQSPPLSSFPNDGGYNPMECGVLSFFDCTDTRASLGRMAGVDVVAFRNSHSNITNFRDSPPGLRVYDFDMPEPSGEGIRYIGQAHADVLFSSAVAACLIDEMNQPGACRWHDHQLLPSRIDDWVAVRP